MLFNELESEHLRRSAAGCPYEREVGDVRAMPIMVSEFTPWLRWEL
jgi:hypothetical protein